jgi:hypothetical protein
VLLEQGHYEQYEGVEWDKKHGAPPVFHFYDGDGNKFSSVTIEREQSVDDIHGILQANGFVRCDRQTINPNDTDSYTICVARTGASPTGHKNIPKTNAKIFKPEFCPSQRKIMMT